MSGQTSNLGGGAPGVALQLLGGGANSTSGSGMEGGAMRSQERFVQRNAFAGKPLIGTQLFQFNMARGGSTANPTVGGAISGLVVRNGVNVPSSESPLVVQPPFCDTAGNVIATLPGAKLGTNPVVQKPIDLTKPVTFIFNIDTWYVKATATDGDADCCFLCPPLSTDPPLSYSFVVNGAHAVRPVCGPFRSALSAGDELGRNQQVAGGASMVTGVGKKPVTWKMLGGGVSAGITGQEIYVGGQRFASGTGAKQVPVQSGNPKFVYDGSDYARYKRLAATNRNYNDSSFGGPSKAGAGGSGMFTALNRVRR